jgi:hypothetical protein
MTTASSPLGLSILTLILAVTAAGCGGGVSPDNDGGLGRCGVIEIIPPSVTVRTSTGSTTCDPTFSVLDRPDGATSFTDGAGPERCPGIYGGCPDSGAATCTYVLLGLDNEVGQTGSFTIEVSEPGFAPARVSGVHLGTGGCVSTPSPASQVVVTLKPLH